MSKAVMLSIRPKWCEKIVNGNKTIEVRKTRPKMNPPFKCYIYCTLPKYPHEDFIATNYPMPQFYGGGKVIGEFTCDRVYEIRKRGVPENYDYCYLSLNEWGNDDIAAEINAISASCGSKGELNAYGARTPVLYGWHISNLRIYDTPRDLGEFSPECTYKADDGTCPSRRVACSFQRYDDNQDGTINIVECGRVIERPPQSWCYVEED